MKSYPLILVLIALIFAGCATNSPPAPRPFLGILSAQKIGTGPRDSSLYEVNVRYEDVEPDNYEIKIGFGYNTTDANLAKLAGSDGVYAIAESEVLRSASGDIKVQIDPSVVLKMGGTLDGKIHAILSKYPHGKEWIVTRHAVFVLDVE